MSSNFLAPVAVKYVPVIHDVIYHIWKMQFISGLKL